MAKEPEDTGLTETSDAPNVVAFVAAETAKAEFDEGHSADIISLHPSPDESDNKAVAGKT